MTEFRIVLVRPKYPANLGAIARVAGNFGIRDVRVVSPEPECAQWRQNSEAQKLAVAHAAEIFSSIQEHETLGQALAGVDRSIAFTRRPGRNRQAALPYFDLLTTQLLHSLSIALVFGNETMGLSEGEVLQCTSPAFIPTSAHLGSMNLSHAVAVVASRTFELQSRHDLTQGLANRLQQPKAQGDEHDLPAKHDERDALYLHWREALLKVGLNQAGNPDRMLRGIRNCLESRTLSRREISLFRGFLSRVIQSNHRKEDL